ncbi:NAD(P)-dependent oxidoreductase [Pseudomonas lundensis]|uniref:NAD-dependent epimerase/dehydratase family protein n=1 Tax=Pseudomonas lundensis TaxID=86185 RepID=UPI0014740488|nr:NAD(P)-dependent oxidoreductase [Pseudomonas lundensis]NNA16427.1 NAD(P)-dependent oxidoreductase [Pseudomonas lundensis]
MKVLITGITGYIGRRLAAYSKALGHEVIGLVRDNLEDGDYFVYDGTYASIKHAVTSSRPDIVFHLAAAYSRVEEDIEPIVDANLKLPIYLAQALNNSSAVFIAVGSFWQFGCANEQYSPLDTYSASKEALEKMLEFYSSNTALKIRVVYLYGTYGDGDGRGKFLDSLITSVNNNEVLGVSPGFQILNLVHADDVVRALFLAADEALNGGSGAIKRFCVNGDEELTLRELVDLCGSLANKRMNVTFGAIPYREKEIMQPRYPFPRVPNWSQQVALHEYVLQRLKV